MSTTDSRRSSLADALHATLRKMGRELDGVTAEQFCRWGERSARRYRPPAGRLVRCPAHPGRSHWGAAGAAGVVMYGHDESGTTYVLMQQRSAGVQGGACWTATVGGALEYSERPHRGAIREAHEECSGLGRVRVNRNFAHTFKCECGWQYTTFVAQLGKRGHLPSVTVTDGADSWESTAVQWVPAELVSQMDLHPRFRKAWPALRSAIPGAQS